MTTLARGTGTPELSDPEGEFRAGEVHTRPSSRAPNGFAHAAGAWRAALLFAGIWLASALVLVVTGRGFPFDAFLKGLAFLLLSVLTVVVTQPAPAPSIPVAERPRLWLQIGLILLFVLLTAWRGLAFHHVIGPDVALSLWSPVVDALGSLGDRWFGNGNYLANPVTYTLAPLLVLLLAGARLRGLGFGPGDRVGGVLLLWCSLPVAAFAYAVLAGQLTPERLGRRLLSNSLNNGFFEEFLFRGALQTRLRRLTTVGWALVIQALVFGGWHLGLGFTDTGHAGWFPALASAFVNQAVIGLASGIVFEQSRNLLAPSVIHTVFNTL